MKNHKIDLEGLLDYKNNQRVLYAKSSAQNKALYILANGGYEVEHNGIVALRCNQPYEAVEKYNSITE